CGPTLGVVATRQSMSGNDPAGSPEERPRRGCCTRRMTASSVVGSQPLVRAHGLADQRVHSHGYVEKKASSKCWLIISPRSTRSSCCCLPKMAVSRLVGPGNLG